MLCIGIKNASKTDGIRILVAWLTYPTGFFLCVDFISYIPKMDKCINVQFTAQVRGSFSFDLENKCSVRSAWIIHKM